MAGRRSPNNVEITAVTWFFVGAGVDEAARDACARPSGL